MADSRSLLSVGIDVGTTTTQVVFSRLGLADVARPGQIPRMAITERQILYQSPIFMTPLRDRETVDADQLNDIIRGEYTAAKVEPAQVETGAVIITGETARKKNADVILRALSGLAGEFVVSIAGPHVESLIAGRGSGAALYSQTHYTSVTNLDIGGGSANSVIFRSGEYVSAAAMNFGGRILEIEHPTGRVRHITAAAAHILQDCGLTLKVGDTASLADLRRFSDRVADMAVELIEGRTSPLAEKLYLTPPAKISSRGSVLMFSGGIGHTYYHPVKIEDIRDATVYDDFGPLLAESLRKHPGLAGYEIVPPAESMRATVLGASTQSITLSGSTIWAEREILPLRNVPVVHPQLDSAAGPAQLVEAVQDVVRRWDLDVSGDPFAISIDLEKPLDYAALIELAVGLGEFSRSLAPQKPLVVIIQRDYAQALGQTIKGMLPDRPLLVIDQIGLMEGDFIDIGAPLMDGRVVPLSVKTLVFYH